MIYIDDREGSKELHPRFLMKYSPVLVRLDYADAAFEGKGPDGNVDIGVERKVIGDLLSSISTGRLSGHQVPGLVNEYYRVYLIVEGYWRAGDSGIIEIKSGSRWNLIRHGRRYRYKDVLSYLSTLETMAGITVRFTHTITETIATIQSLYDWWQKAWDTHKAHMQISKPPPRAMYLNPNGPSLLRRVAVELPGIGYERVKYVEAVFHTVEEMVMATREDWQNVPGIGKVTAGNVFKALRGEM